MMEEHSPFLVLLKTRLKIIIPELNALHKGPKRFSSRLKKMHK